MDKNAVIETENLTKIYRAPFSKFQVKALDNLNIKVNRGEIFGFLGPNGSGKTTTMKILLGLLIPTSGNAWVLGRPASDVAVKDRIGFLPEESYLYRFLSAEETLDFYGRIFRIPSKERRKRIGELIDLVGLGHARTRQVKEYSKGMARRLGFAQALINDPEVIFLDEPTSGLDPLVARQVKDIVLDLKKQGKTVFMSSHLLADVENICDRVAILHLGKLQKVGAVKELISSPDVSEIGIKGLNQAALESIKGLVAKNGGEVVSVQPSTETLETLFLKTIKPESKSDE
ncbi:MAG: ABC transporter ATP-binding protein [Planctomycetes bacterium]|nr:ABC transporter ATP-binding protein [Planctomycetota bacterium]